MVVVVYWYTGKSVSVQLFTASAYRLVKAGLHWLYDIFFSTFAAPFFQKLYICLSVQASYVTTCHIDYDVRMAGVCDAFYFLDFILDALILSCIQRRSLPHELVHMKYQTLIMSI